MSRIDQNVNVIQLNEGTKKLLGIMNFAAIPAEANYLAFFEDGSAQFFEALDLDAPFVIGAVSIFVTYHTGVTLVF